jgi:hypothetical protein
MSEGKGIKSAWELAMERLDSKQGAPASLTDAQKQALAEIDRRAQAKSAGLRIQEEPGIAANRVAGNLREAALLEADLRDRLQRIAEEAEAEKQRIRDGK